MVASIPTMWRGVRFRSRLEARWAAFFSKLGWEWSYEPIDLEGYIPDFLLHLHHDVLVEVKPFTRLDDHAVAAAHEKIDGSGWYGDTPPEEYDWAANDAIVVGARLFVDPGGPCEGIYLGSLHGWDRAVLGVCPACKGVGFRAESGSYRNRCCGAYDGDRFACTFYGHTDTANEVLRHWDAAGNEVQWRSARA